MATAPFFPIVVAGPDIGLIILGIGIALFFPLVKLFVIGGQRLEKYLNGRR